MDIKDALQEPLKDLNSENVQEIFERIAKNLLNNFCIKCGETTTYFLEEIEFYYYKEGVWCDSITYKREGYNVGDFFYHLSGVDICFNCRTNAYGGLLIRSISTTEGKIIYGPLKCLMEILNACKNDQMPCLTDLTEPVRKQNTYDVLVSGRINLGEDAGQYRNSKLRAVLCDKLYRDSEYKFKETMISEFLSKRIKQGMSIDEAREYAKEKLGYVPSALK